MGFHFLGNKPNFHFLRNAIKKKKFISYFVMWLQCCQGAMFWVYMVRDHVGNTQSAPK